MSDAKGHRKQNSKEFENLYSWLVPSGVAKPGSKKTTPKKGDKSESENKGAGWQVVDCDEVAKSKTQREKRRVPKTDRTKTSKLATSPSPSADTCPTTPPPQETTKSADDRIRDRLWAGLFRNITRAVDDLYNMCEFVSDIEKCERATELLDECHNDFFMLFERLLQIGAVESTQQDQNNERPQAIAFNVRKKTTPLNQSKEFTRLQELEAEASTQQEVYRSEERKLRARQREGFDGHSEYPVIKLSLPPTSAWSRPLQQNLGPVDFATTATKTANITRSPTSSVASLKKGKTPTSHALHEKLSSPDRKRSGKKMRERVQLKHENARRMKERLDQARMLKMKAKNDRIKAATTLLRAKLEEQKKNMEEGLKRADLNRAKHLRSIAKKAGNESIKVAEVTFINQIKTRNREIGLQTRLKDAEKRREERLANIRAKRAMLNAKGMEIKKRQEIKSKSESEKLMADMNKRFDEAEERRNKRLSPERPSRVFDSASKGERSPLINLNERIASAPTSPDIKTRRKKPSARQPSPNSKQRKHSPKDLNFSASSDKSQQSGKPLLTKNKKKRARGFRKKLENTELRFEESHEITSAMKGDRIHRKLQQLLNAAERAIAPTNNQSHNTAVRDLCVFLEAQTEPRPMVLESFRVMGGVELVAKAFTSEKACFSRTLLVSCLRAMRVACRSTATCEMTLLSPTVFLLVDLLSFMLPAAFNHIDAIDEALSLFTCLMTSNLRTALLPFKCTLISFVVNKAFVLYVGQLLNAFISSETCQGPLKPKTVFNCIAFVESMANVERQRYASPSHLRANNFAPRSETTALLSELTGTEALGVLSIMLSFIMSENQSSLRRDICHACIVSTRVLLHFASLNSRSFQSMLSSSSMQMQFHHVIAQLLLFSQEGMTLADEGLADMSTSLLNLTIKVLGCYALGSRENQGSLHWGRSPTPLNCLCSVPIQYFSDDKAKAVLFPTLIAVCLNNERNTAVLREELSPSMLRDYICEHSASRESTAAATAGASLAPWEAFAERCPPALWPNAQKYFENAED